jgi:NTP pyrophosphatase (non-canonical NTP hydrolase)
VGRLTVLLTSPRLPAGLLTATAWRAVDSADVVATADLATPGAAALSAAGIDVREMPDAAAGDLLLLAADRVVVWLDHDGGGSGLTADLAAVVVRRSESRAGLETSGDGPEIEVLVGSFDPVGARLLDAVEVMDRLREDCPWDREQTHESLVPYLIEEAYEVVEAIETADLDLLREELGDLLFQILFHSRVAAESAESPFTVDDVAADLVAKLIRRHPHVFADTVVSGSAEVATNWEQIKRAEKGRRSIVDGIPQGLPALSLAASVIDRAVRADAVLGVPVPGGDTAYTEETLGDVLFALAAAARAGGLDPERALRARVRREIDALRDSEQRAVPTDQEQRG